jgi:hypothetical protein
MTKDNNLSDDLSKLSEKMENLAEEVNQQVEEVVKKVDEKIEQIGGEPRKKSRKHWDNSFWGIVLIVVGLLWLGNNLHWFRIHLPIWPLVLIVIGLYLLLDHRHRP